jgi:hypothetical protein
VSPTPLAFKLFGSALAMESKELKNIPKKNKKKYFL